MARLTDYMGGSGRPPSPPAFVASRRSRDLLVRARESRVSGDSHPEGPAGAGRPPGALTSCARGARAWRRRRRPVARAAGSVRRRHDVALGPGGEERQLALRRGPAAPGVVGAVQDDARHGDRRALGEAALDVVEARIAGRVAVAVPVGVDHDVDEVGIVERRRGVLEGRVVEAPGRRPFPPQQPAELAAVLRQAGAPALGVEVPLVPEARSCDREAGRGGASVSCTL